MKRIWALAVILVLCLAGCGRELDVAITIPAGNENEFVYSEMEVTPNGNNITIMAKQGMRDGLVCLKAADGQGECCEATYLTPGAPVKFEAKKGVWYKIGVSGMNSTTEDYKMLVTVKGAQVRIA